ncbi:MAG: M24 family metallopeptidase [Verrucomicrobiota bacterium]|nr:M24 family metallopeptidase [Verrucomicrobiota bacterium]MDP7048063.1 M24 family metallopeptidase [Verrucomicrobiota bacterium]
MPATNMNVRHRIQFSVGDAVFYICLPRSDGGFHSILLVRDIEMGLARKHARADEIGCAADYEPECGLSGDRDTALAQAGAECLRRNGIERVRTDGSLPMIFTAHLRDVGIDVQYDPQLAVLDRRTKSDKELAHLREAQAVTEEAMEFACHSICAATPDEEGILRDGDTELTSELMRQRITSFLIGKNCSNHHDSIVVTVPHVADCHHHGSGPLLTGLPVIVDIFPRVNATGYWGDCTRTAVNGEPSSEIVQMHAAVVKAKADAIDALRVGTTGDAVHQATVKSITGSGYVMGLPPEEAGEDFTSMRHGTGHGIGLDVHESILLSNGGGEILVNEVFTVEPGLYSAKFGGVRVEDMVVVTEAGPINFNRIPDHLDWR